MQKLHRFLAYWYHLACLRGCWSVVGFYGGTGDVTMGFALV